MFPVHLAIMALTHRRAAAERERQRQHEEETAMTGYTSGDLQGHWQFKIVRGNFKTREQIDAVVAEQAEWGWILVEVFDQNRIRFKRSPSEAAKDTYRDGNPYATTSGAGVGCLPAATTLVVLVILAAMYYLI